jgi:cytochrome b561
MEEKMHRYALPTILLHWAMAAAIAGAWLIGQFAEDAPRGSALIGAHGLLGLAVLALLLPRVLARLLGGAPADAGAGWERGLARAAHGLLYALMLAVPLSGLGIAMAGRAPFPVLGLFEVPNLLAGLGLRGALEGAHEVAANLLLMTVLLHIAATLWHALVRRDGVAARMSPF